MSRAKVAAARIQCETRALWLWRSTFSGIAAADGWEPTAAFLVKIA